MTRTEAIFDIIKGLPELEMSELINQIHDHCWANGMGHLFDELYDDSYAIEELKNEVIIAEGPCTCTDERKGTTKIECCNICGKPVDEFWTKKMEL